MLAAEAAANEKLCANCAFRCPAKQIKSLKSKNSPQTACVFWEIIIYASKRHTVPEETTAAPEAAEPVAGLPKARLQKTTRRVLKTPCAGRTEGRRVSRCLAARQSGNRECAPASPGGHRQGCEVRHRPLRSRTAGGEGQPRSCAGHRRSQRREPARGHRTDPQATGRRFREIGTDRSQSARREVRPASTSGDQRRRIEQEPNTVVTVLQKGYLLADRVLRPALVVVAKASA
jgi:hypothetical protein